MIDRQRVSECAERELRERETERRRREGAEREREIES